MNLLNHRDFYSWKESKLASLNLSSQFLKFLNLYQIELNDFKLETTQLKFFNPEIIFARGIDKNKKVEIKFIKDTENYVLLNRTQESISLAAQIFQAKISKQTIFDYLCFYYDHIIGKNGRFFIFNSLNIIPEEINSQTSVMMPKIIDKKLDRYAISADILYYKRIFNVVIIVNNKGQVKMLEETLNFKAEINYTLHEDEIQFYQNQTSQPLFFCAM